MSAILFNCNLTDDDKKIICEADTEELNTQYDYYDIPEYADMYASEAVSVEKRASRKNPMISAQTYINKGRALYHLGEKDSLAFYLEHATKLTETLPYNSGMVDVEIKL